MEICRIYHICTVVTDNVVQDFIVNWHIADFVIQIRIIFFLLKG
jgi:hypothetical protein